MNSTRQLLLSLTAATSLFAMSRARADELVRPDEMEARDLWVHGTLLSLDKPVVSFTYNGIPSAEFLPGWRRSPISSEALSDGRTQYRLEWSDPATGLTVRVVVVVCGDYPAVEWTGYLVNKGFRPTPVIEQLRGLDSSFAVLSSMDITLRTTRGDNFSAGSYEPLSYELNQIPRCFQPVGGRPTNGAWPYFNLDGGQEGVILALGWPGQWQAQFSKDKNIISAWGGQETTHLVLLPGEEIRTPLTVVLFWKGESWVAGQNLWRHWFLAHNIPRPHGKLPPPDTAIAFPELRTSADEVKAFLDANLSHGFKTDYLWVDAGWYEMDKGWFAAKGIGSWKPDPARYPRGIREVSDYAHAKGLKFILWFEPERVYRGSFLWDNHPEWLLSWNPDDVPSNKPKDRKDLRLLNLGNPGARRWLTDYVSRFITDQGVDLYRQDFNVNPLGAWQNNDAPDRQGITENFYVQGYLAYWDALLQQHPNMLIDTCASGGRRNDLETLRRSVPLLRSDYQAPNLPSNKFKMSTDVFDGNQGHTYGLSLWVPFYGSGEYAEDVYSSRSHLCPFIIACTHMGNPDWAALARQLADHRAVEDCFYGDYYPLTSYSKSEDVWMAWEFIQPSQGNGMIQAFRRENSPDVIVNLKLQGLKSGAVYEFTNLDSGRETRSSGADLMTRGIRLEAASPRTALILTFKEIP